LAEGFSVPSLKPKRSIHAAVRDSDVAGDPATRLAIGRISQLSLLESLNAGEWGSNPGGHGGDPGMVELWGNGINKLASLMATNTGAYNALFGAEPMG
jgi:hypothetical protein